MGTGEGRPWVGVKKYRIELRPVAVKALRQVQPQERERIRGAIALLGSDPRPPGAKAPQGRDVLRVRVGNYRIIYTIQDDVLLIVVVTLGHRRDVYER